jgi:hypothetical protein
MIAADVTSAGSMYRFQAVAHGRVAVFTVDVLPL